MLLPLPNCSLSMLHICMVYRVSCSMTETQGLPQLSGKNCGKFLGCKTVFSSAFHPQADGQTERHNQTIEQVVQALGHEHGLSWLC